MARRPDTLENNDDGFAYPEAADYGILALGEPAPGPDGFDDGSDEDRFTERHLQCVWYSDRLRPAIVTDGGEAVEVESCGRWNLEAGPDFLDAVLRVGPERRRVVGDVEIHVRPGGWTSHGHAGDVRYANVVLHVTYYPGPRPADLPAGVLCASLRDGLRASPRFSFEAIDIAAFPHAEIPSTPRPCREAWGGDPDKAGAILCAAGAYRLDAKRRRLRAALREKGDRKAVLHEAVFAALGYKRNAEAFRRLAAALPLREWTGDKVIDFARLLGVAGLLPEIPSRDDPREPFVHRLWEAWWRHGAEPPAQPIAWVLDGSRPQNSPVRRLAAGAAIFSDSDALDGWLEKSDIAKKGFPLEAAKKIVELASFEEMEPLYGLSGKAPPADARPMALVGRERASSIVANALVPYLAALHPKKAKALYDRLPAETLSAPMRLMASRLFGPDHNPRLLYEGDGLRQQGLLQIYLDFCLSCKAGCAGCAFGASKTNFHGE